MTEYASEFSARHESHVVFVPGVKSEAGDHSSSSACEAKVTCDHSEPTSLTAIATLRTSC